VTTADIEVQFTDLGSASDTSFTVMERVLEAYQRQHCPVYQRFGYKYLPVAAFKHAEVTTFPPAEAECVFKSSATGGALRSRHFVRRMAVYEASVCAAFKAVFGEGPYQIWAHLPGYAPASSLVCMMKILMRKYGTEESQFFLSKGLPNIIDIGAPILLFGAAFGLLDLADTGPRHLPKDARIIETGGMKTHRRAITRSELHARLAAGFGIDEQRVWSEYGMCELMSQAYAQGGPIYRSPPWMRVRVVDPEAPDRVMPDGKPGLLAITDLANLYTVSSILTEDLGVSRGGGFEVLGRFPGSAMRGCNFLLGAN
jgi:hypothetical protein